MPANDELNAIEAAAADWLIRRDHGLTPAQQREFARWQALDPRHVAAFEALAATWALLGEAKPVAAPAAASRRTMWWPAALAAAAAIALAFAAWPRAARDAGPAPAADYELAAETEIGGLRKVELPDGSVIQLNTGSAVAVRFGAAERRVRLVRGEAHFAVAKNPGRPFIVNAAGVDVRVMGTVFNVRLRPDAVDVLVTEGRVSVQSPERKDPMPASPVPGRVAAAELTAGQKLSVELRPDEAAPAAQPVAVRATAIRQALAWQERRLEFDATPLDEIVAEFNRHTRHELAIADERLRGRRFGGSFAVTDHETFVRMLEKDFGVAAERSAGRTVLRLQSQE